MKKVPLYSRSPRALASAGEPAGGPATVAGSAAGSTGIAAAPAGRRQRFGRWALRHERRLWAAAVVLLLAGAVFFNPRVGNTDPPLTMEQIDAAMRQSIEDKPLPSAAARAYETVLPAVVRVVGLMTDGDDGSDESGAKGMVERGVGTGVVIVDNGTILTNLHVVSGAKRIKVTFMDGTESDAMLLNVQPENDLAVLRAKTIPDDLEAATMRSTGDLAPGDHVIAVGFPFGIGFAVPIENAATAVGLSPF